MGDLRKQWSKAKDQAKASFEVQPVARAVTHDAHISGLPPYPLKFDKDLGPSLDAFEKAKQAKKPADVKKYGDKAKAAITEYKKQIAAANSVNKDARSHLEQALNDISKKLV